jgi:uncharacterized repeat protein (TIGR01451 family)
MLQLTNYGPVTASGVIVSQSFSLGVTNVILTPSIGTATYTNGVATWQVGILSTNIAASLSTTLRATQAGSLTIASSAFHSLNDSFWGNNVALDIINITNSTTSNNVLLVQLPVRNLVYDTFRNLIYAATPASNRLAGNLIAVMNPATGKLVSARQAGSEPDQLALSDDGQFLYVAQDGAVGAQRFNLLSNSADRSFSFSTNDIYFAQDLAVQPKHPNTVAASLASYNFASGYPSSVYLYDDGLARPSVGGPARGLTFDAMGQVLFGYVAPGFGNGLVRMSVNTNGFVTDTQPVFSVVPGNLKYSNGRIYSASGQVADPYAPALIGTFTGASGPQAIDSTAGRGYYLAQRTPNWEIRAFDLATLQSTATQTVMNVQGTPSNLILCGSNRLAFCTTANQIFIVQSQVVATNALLPANLGIAQQAFQDFTSASETLRFVMTVTNRGPGAASNVILAIKPPAPVASVTFQLPQGTSASAGANYLCKLGSLSAGASLAVTLSAIITNTAIFSNQVTVSASTPDPDLSDNASFASVQGLYFQRPDSLQAFSLAATTLAYDPARQRLFAVRAPQGATNQLAWFDPQTGVMLGSMLVDIPATGALITDDAQYLYLTSTSTNLVERVNLQSLSVDLGFSPTPTGGMGAAAIIPGQPRALALEYVVGGVFYASVFDDGVSRSNQVSHYFKLLTAATDDSAVYGYDNSTTGGNSPDVFRMALSASGLRPLDNGPSDTPWGANVQMRFSQGLVFFANGNVMDPSTWTEQQAFPLPDWGTGFDLVPAADRAGFLTYSQFGIYSISNRQLLAQFNLGSLTSPLTSATWCGADRFAFCNGSQLYFVRSSAIQAADIVVRAAFSTNQITIGDAVNLQVTVSNSGPLAASGVFVTNNVPTSLKIQSATLSSGTIVSNAQSIVGSIGTLGPNGTAVLSLVVSADTAGWVTNTVDVGATSPADPIPFNNHASQSLFVMPPVIVGVNVVFDQSRGSNVLQFTLSAGGGSAFGLQTSTDLNHWTNVLTFPSKPGDHTLEAPFDPSATAAFYRLRFTAN